MYTYLVLITTARLIMTGVCSNRTQYIYTNVLDDWLDHNNTEDNNWSEDLCTE
jgi:hypothetical protein